MRNNNIKCNNKIQKKNHTGVVDHSALQIIKIIIKWLRNRNNKKKGKYMRKKK